MPRLDLDYTPTPDQYGNDVQELPFDLSKPGGLPWSWKRFLLETALGMGGAAFGGMYLQGLNGLGGATSGLAGGVPGAAPVPGLGSQALSNPFVGGMIPGMGSTPLQAFPGTTAALGGGGGGTTAANVGRNSFMNALKSPEGVSSAISGGLGLTSALLAKGSQNDQQDWQYGQSLAAHDADEQLDRLRRQQSVMDTFNMNPLGQQEQMMKSAARAKLASHGPIQLRPGGIVNPLNFNDVSEQYMNNDALTQAAQRFYSAVGALDPNQPIPDLSTAGLRGGNVQQQQGILNNSVADALKRMNDLSRQRRQDLLNGIRNPDTRARFQQSQDYFSRLT